MVKRRLDKNKKILQFVPKEFSIVEDKPKCFGEWKAYCSKELCGKYYEECSKKK